MVKYGEIGCLNAYRKVDRSVNETEYWTLIGFMIDMLLVFSVHLTLEMLDLYG